MTRDSGFKLKTVNLDLGVRKNFLCVCVVRHWNQLPRELWKAHPWKCSRTGMMEFWMTHCRGLQ